MNAFCINAAHPSYIIFFVWKVKINILYASLSAMFNLLHNSMSQELLEKITSAIKVATMKVQEVLFPFIIQYGSTV